MCTLVPDREVYDDAQILMRYADDTLGRMWCSLTAAGNEHGMGFRVYGTEGALVWRQERPQELILQHADGWAEAITPGYPDRLSPAGAHACRLRGGHPEGYILAFANLYRDFADTVMARNLGARRRLVGASFPNSAGRRGDAALLRGRRPVQRGRRCVGRSAMNSAVDGARSGGP